MQHHSFFRNLPPLFIYERIVDVISHLKKCGKLSFLIAASTCETIRTSMLGHFSFQPPEIFVSQPGLYQTALAWERRATLGFQRRCRPLGCTVPPVLRYRCNCKGDVWHQSEPGPRNWYLRQIQDLRYLQNLSVFQVSLEIHFLRTF